MGISFAIPIDEAMRVASSSRRKPGDARRIGVAIDNVPKDAAESLGLGRARGAYVAMSSRVARRQGSIEAGDIVLKFNGATSRRPVTCSVRSREQACTRATVQVWRKGATRDLTVTVAELQPDTKVAQRAKAANPTMASRAPASRMRLAGGGRSVGRRAARVQDEGRRRGAVADGPPRAPHPPGRRDPARGRHDVTSAKQFNDVVAGWTRVAWWRCSSAVRCHAGRDDATEHGAGRRRPAVIQLTLYGRAYCHLCDDMKSRWNRSGATFLLCCTKWMSTVTRHWRSFR